MHTHKINAEALGVDFGQANGQQEAVTMRVRFGVVFGMMQMSTELQWSWRRIVFAMIDDDDFECA
jgi:hypothetical protein